VSGYDGRLTERARRAGDAAQAHYRDCVGAAAAGVASC